MKKYVESAQRRQERIANHARLSTKIVESKKVYNRKRDKQKLRKEEY
jgi:hypothetical protein